MQTMVNFLNILAWIFLVLSGGLVVLRIWAAYNYSELEEALDRYKGVQASFPIMKPSMIFIICASWLVAQNM